MRKTVLLPLITLLLLTLCTRSRAENSFIPAFERGKRLSQLGMNQQAISCFDEAAKLSPNREEIYSSRAACWTALGRWEKAITDYNKAIMLAPTGWQQYKARADLFFRLGHYEFAGSDYLHAYLLHPAWELRQALGLLYLSIYNPASAILELNEAIKIAPTQTALYETRADAYLSLRKYEEAMNDGDKVIQLNPRSSNGYLIKGRIYEAAKKTKLALEQYNLAIAVRSDCWQSYLYRASLNQRLGEHAKAKEDLDRGHKLMPETVSSHIALAKHFEEIREPENAIAEYSRAIKLAPGMCTLHAQRSRVYFSLGDDTRACSDMIQEMANCPPPLRYDRNDQVSFYGAPQRGLRATTTLLRTLRSPEAYYLHGLYCLSAARATEGLEDLSQAIALSPNFAIAYLHRSELYQLQGVKQFDKAIQDIERAQSLNPLLPRLPLVKSMTLAAYGETSKALQALEPWIALNQRDPQAYLTRGTIYALQEKYKLAEADFTTAISLGNIQGYSKRAELRRKMKRYDLDMNDWVTICFATTPTNVIDLNQLLAAWYLSGADENWPAKYEKVVQEMIDPRLKNLYAALNVQLQIGEWPNAITTANQIIQFNPHSWFPYALRAYAFKGAGDYERAIQDCNHSIELQADNELAYLWRAQAFALSGRDQLALTDYCKVSAINWRLPVPYAWRAAQDHHFRRQEEAISNYSRLIALLPENAAFYEERAKEYEKLGDKALADRDRETKQLIVDQLQTSRLVHFPKVAIGDLYRFNCDNKVYVSSAQGVIKVPIGSALELHCYRLDQEALQSLEQMTGDQLAGLNFHGCPINDHTLNHLRNFSCLRLLNLHATKITDAGLGHLKHPDWLQNLDLGVTAITTAGLTGLGPLPHLRELNLSASHVSDSMLQNLGTYWPTLNALYLSQTAITDAGLAYSQASTSLKTLDLSGTKITDAGIMQIATKYPCLRRLYLDRTKITEASIPSLARLKELKWLTLAGTKLTSTDRLTLQLPRCHIITGGQKDKPVIYFGLQAYLRSLSKPASR